MIFLDTSAVYALGDRADAEHATAKKLLSELLASGERLLTHNYVLVESMALLQHRLGLRAALALAESASRFEVEWISKEIHEAAFRGLARRGKPEVSFVDQVSFIVMRNRGVTTALAFDEDFENEGFRLYSV